MANFLKSLPHTLKNEGLYVNDPNDSGGETFRGVSRKNNPQWAGWAIVDSMKQEKNFPQNLTANTELGVLVATLYRAKYWDKIRGNEISNQVVADTIFDFAVNAGSRTSVKLAQIIVGVKVDGVLGSKTLLAINSQDEKVFIPTFAITKIARYVQICGKRPSNRKYFYGWVRRTLEIL